MGLRQKKRLFVSLAVGAAALALLAAAACGQAGTGQDTPTAQGALSPVIAASPEAEGSTEMPVTTQAPVATQAAVATSTPSLPETGEENTTAVPPPPTEQVVSVPPEAEKLVDLARADLARLLGVAEAEVVVRSVEAVEWPDGSLGCPLPGVDYPQVVTPGYRMVLVATGETYEYHTDRNGVVVPCLPPIDLKPLPIPPKDADDRTPWQPIDGPTVIIP